MKKNICLFISLLTAGFCNLKVSCADTLPIEWKQTFGGSEFEWGNSVQQTSDGGYIIVGTTSGFGAGYCTDVYLVKTDSAGNLLWQKTFGKNNSDLYHGYDHGESVQQTSDEGYIIAGATLLPGGPGTHHWQVYLIKTDSNGNSQWEKTFGGFLHAHGDSVQQTFDGGFIIAGESVHKNAEGLWISDVYLIKTDPGGNSQWQKTFPGNIPAFGRSVQQTSDGGYIIAGGILHPGTGINDVYLIKTDSYGNSQWQKTFGDGDDEDVGHSVQQTSDGGYIIAGGTSGTGDGDVYLIKTDSSGNILWQKTLGGSSYDWGWSVQQTSYGRYIIAGSTCSFGAGSSDVYLIKTDSAGNLRWQQTLGGSNSDSGNSVQQTIDGGYIISGTTDSFGAGGYDVYLIKLAPSPTLIVVIPGINDHGQKMVEGAKSLSGSDSLVLEIAEILGLSDEKILDMSTQWSRMAKEQGTNLIVNVDMDLEDYIVEFIYPPAINRWHYSTRWAGEVANMVAKAFRAVVPDGLRRLYSHSAGGDATYQSLLQSLGSKTKKMYDEINILNGRTNAGDLSRVLKQCGYEWSEVKIFTSQADLPAGLSVPILNRITPWFKGSISNKDAVANMARKGSWVHLHCNQVLIGDEWLEPEHSTLRDYYDCLGRFEVYTMGVEGERYEDTFIGAMQMDWSSDYSKMALTYTE